MSLSVNIPEINITSEAEEEDDEHLPANFSEQLTDVEDIADNANESTVSINRKRNKLKIKLPKESSAFTDVEDFEASSDEQQVDIVEHEKPLTLKELDFEVPISEESYQKQLKGIKGRKKVRTQTQMRQKNFYQLSSITNRVDENTDVEAYETDDDIYENIPESEMDIGACGTQYFISDSTVPVFPFSTDSCQFRNDTKIRASSILSIPFNEQESYTDIEEIDSDSDEEITKRKNKKVRRRQNAMIDIALTDVEDIYVSDNSGRQNKKLEKPRRRSKTILNRAQSGFMESDDDEPEIFPFPLCKKVTKKNSVALEIPTNNINALTDEEEFQSDMEQDQSEVDAVDERALEDRLREIATCYSEVRDAINKFKAKTHRYTISTKLEQDLPGESTDEDKFQTDSAEDNDENDEITSYKIKFSPSISNFKSDNTNLKVLTDNIDDPLTDYECLDEVPENNNRKLPLAIVQQHIPTDEEDISGDDSDVRDFPDISLPSSVRNLMLIQENNSLIPTVSIFPLDTSYTLDEEQEPELENLTDEENIFENEGTSHLYPVDEINRAPTPDLPILEGGTVTMSEAENTTNNYLPNNNIKDSYTDTEEVILDRKQRRKRAPKFKDMYEREMIMRPKLSANILDQSAITDTEDIYVNENVKSNGRTALTLPQNNNSVLTDVEDISSSADDPSYCTTPQQGKEVSPNCLKPINTIDTLITTDDSDDLSANTANNIQKETIEPKMDKINLTSSEDIMYLKGGGYVEAHPGVKYREEYIRMLRMEHKENVIFDLNHYSVAYLCGEWEASKESTDTIESKAVTSKDAAQQGEEHSQASSSQKDTSKSQVEPDSIPEVPDKDKSRKITDQHQLSGEMKELLKQMEKESKE